MQSLKGKTILITGGTDSFGKAMVKHLIETTPHIKQIRIFILCELEIESIWINRD